MSLSWTPDQVLSLAPDSSSAKSGRELSSPGKWVGFARSADESALWGECQGSGRLPYQTQIDLSGGTPTFKCTCPSRKFPCKHGLGLFLMYAARPEAFAAAVRSALDGPPGPPLPRSLLAEPPDTLSAGRRLLQLFAETQDRIATIPAPPVATPIPRTSLSEAPAIRAFAGRHQGGIHLLDAQGEVREYLALNAIAQQELMDLFTEARNDFALLRRGQVRRADGGKVMQVTAKDLMSMLQGIEKLAQNRAAVLTKLSEEKSGPPPRELPEGPAGMLEDLVRTPEAEVLDAEFDTV